MTHNRYRTLIHHVLNCLSFETIVYLGNHCWLYFYGSWDRKPTGQFSGKYRFNSKGSLMPRNRLKSCYYVLRVFRIFVFEYNDDNTSGLDIISFFVHDGAELCAPLEQCAYYYYIIMRGRRRHDDTIFRTYAIRRRFNI